MVMMRTLLLTLAIGLMTTPIVAADGTPEGNQEIQVLYVHIRYTLPHVVIVDQAVEFVCVNATWLCTMPGVCPEILESGAPDNVVFIDPGLNGGELGAPSPYEEDRIIHPFGGHTSVEVSLSGC